MITIEGDKNSLIVTVLEEREGGYIGSSVSLSKTELLNKLIEEGIIEDGETIHFDDEII